MLKNSLNYRIINLAALMLLFYIGLSNIGLWINIITKCLQVLSPFIVGFAFAYAFTPLARTLQKKGIKKPINYIIIIIGVMIIVITLLIVTLPLLYDQLILFGKMIAEVLNNINNKFHISFGSFEIKLTDYLNTMVKDISAVTSSTTVDILNKSFDLFSKFILGFVSFIYFLIDMDKIRDAAKEILKSLNPRTFKYIKCMDTEILNYLKGLETFMLIQLFEYSILFLIIGHPNWLILGILACLTTVIPYFGGLITNLIAIIMASVVSLPLVILTTIICIIFPQLDGYYISPKVYGKTNNINPLITIIVVSIGGTLKGVTGIIVALPCYLLIRTTYYFFKKDLHKGMSIVKETI